MPDIKSNRKMRALYFAKGGLALRRDHPVPEPEEGEALIRVLMAGICRTDIEITEGYMGFSGVPGHEFVGLVENSPGREGLKGKRVVGEINVGCGRCALCFSGLRNHCPQRRVLGILGKDGAFAEYITLPVDNLHVVPQTVTDQEAVFTEPLAAAFEILEGVQIERHHRVCVLGDGKLGLLAAQVLALTGCDITVVGRHRDRFSRFKVLVSRVAFLHKAPERSFDIVVDCTGSPQGLDEALGLVTPRGTVVLKTTSAGGHKADLNRVVIDEVTIVGSRCGPFEPALKTLERGDVEVRPLIEDVLPLESGPKAFESARKRGAMKVLLKIQD